VFTAVVYVLTSGCARRHPPPTFGTSSATAHRRFTVWTEVGLWRRLHRAVLDELGVRGEVDWGNPHGFSCVRAEDRVVRRRGAARCSGTTRHRPIRPRTAAGPVAAPQSFGPGRARGADRTPVDASFHTPDLHTFTTACRVRRAR
jgi:transposase